MKHTNTRILIIIYFNFLFIYGSLNNVEPFCQLRITTNKNLFFKACFGVPYALPPVEDLRFRVLEKILPKRVKTQGIFPLHNSAIVYFFNPFFDKSLFEIYVFGTLLPIECNNWFHHLNFTKEKLPCIGFNVKGHEDCLYLNIFTPITKNNYLPVIVWIPGQFFLNADTTFLSNGPDYFIEQEVIFVTVSYRQGLFGFASTEDEVLPGNMGIADIFVALKWIKKYIKKFNGDGDNITIMAHGSGAVCVSILQQNYLSKGLFQRIILHSGSSLVTWGRSKNSKRFILKLGKELNLNTNSTDSLVNSLRCYKNISRLHKATKEVYKSFLKDINPLNGNIIGPVLTNIGKFLSGPAHESFFQNNFTSVPIIIGYTVLEAISDSIQYISGYVSKMNSTDFYMSSIKADEKYKDNIGSMIEKNYFMPGVEKNILRSLRFVSEAIFIKPILETSRLMSFSSPVYLYQFSKHGYFEEGMEYPDPGHEAELPYLFSGYRDYPVVPPDDPTRISLIQFWTNFAKFGCPTPYRYDNFTWVKVNEVDDNIVYANIDIKISLKSNPFKENMKFFDDLYDTYGTPPFDTF